MPLDAIQPGATALTRTGAHSSAAVSVRLSMPARAAPEWPMPGMPPHMSAMMLTMAPPFGASLAAVRFSIHCVTHSRAIRKPPVRLLRTTASQPLALIAASGAGNWPPALLTSASMRPWRASTAATVDLHLRLLADVADVRRADAAGAPRSRRCTASSLSTLRPTIATARAERRELVRGAAADARAAAGDDGDLAGEQAGRRRSIGSALAQAEPSEVINQALAW